MVGPTVISPHVDDVTNSNLNLHFTIKNDVADAEKRREQRMQQVRNEQINAFIT